MGPSNCDEKILSYNDVVLRKSDLDILRGPNYLNDRIIEFYFSYLSSMFSSQDILLVPPSISFWITNCHDLSSLGDVIEPLNLSNKKLVIFPVNNNEDVNQAEGGTHWSLLAYDRNMNSFVHHDSIRGLNRWHAKKLYEVVARFMGRSDSASTDHFIECFTPQQKNGYDCGVYVLAITKIICHWHESNSANEADNWFSALEEKIVPSAVTEMRNEILKLILELMNSK